ncbi:MAG: tRNA pseudouridine(38-40) synthase TruA [Bacteroidetes bacterium]|nr:tRNA pseudouridine(38-40) synthase TruA [Bacteroidota bacterium]MCB9225979.1 tRNA pseudouridine(38-40) synthase TruA [Chitinophagales bacterium]
MKYQYSYLIRIQFLGFRFHGWQKQPGLKTIHDSVDKTLSFVFKHTNFKTIGAGRLDAMVSAQNYPLQLFCNEKIEDAAFIISFNKNCPNDFKCLNIEPCSLDFAIINAPKIKTYHYYFAINEKLHPYAAPFMSNFNNIADLDAMKNAATFFEGTHHFKKYCCQPTENTILEREITTCHLNENVYLTGSFFPKQSYVLVVKGAGFLRYQIRYMMAVLAKIGEREISITEFKHSIAKNNDGKQWNFIAPQSGLHLFDVEFIA